MALILELTAGEWYRQNKENFRETVMQDHITRAVEFLNDECTILKAKRHELWVGRNTDNDIVLDNHEVSARHCKLQWTMMHGWCIQDNDSTNGTIIRRKGAVARVIFGYFPLEKGDELIFGQGALILKIA